MPEKQFLNNASIRIVTFLLLFLPVEQNETINKNKKELP